MSPSRSGHGARSIPFKRPYVLAMAAAFLHYLAIVSTATLAYILIRTGDPATVPWLVASVVALALTWLLNHACRRAARCPLCAGTPLLDNSAVKHRKAVRLRPFNHGVTAQLNLLLNRRFRCMYCGTPFDLDRPSKRGGSD